MQKPIGAVMVLLGVVVLFYNVYDVSFGDWEGRTRFKLTRTLWVERGNTDYRLNFSNSTYSYGSIRNLGGYFQEGKYEIVASNKLKCVSDRGVTFYPTFEFHGENLEIRGWWSVPMFFFPHNPPY